MAATTPHVPDISETDLERSDLEEAARDLDIDFDDETDDQTLLERIGVAMGEIDPANLQGSDDEADEGDEAGDGDEDPTAEDTGDEEEAEDGVAEVRATRDARAARATDLAAVTAPLADQAIQVVERDGHAGPERCFLVRRAASVAFRAAAEEVLAERPDLLLGGPWPPYTFAEAGEPTP